VSARRPRLRTRVAVAAAVSIVAAVALLGAAVQLLLARHLHGALDGALRQRAVEVARIQAATPALLTSPGVLETSVGPRQTDIEVVDRRGRILARSLALDGGTIPVQGLVRRVIASGAAGYADTRLGSAHVRVYAAPLAALGGPGSGGAVVVAAPTTDIDATLADSRALIAGSAVVAAILAGAVAFALTGRALRPLGRLVQAAEVIEVRGDPSLRLPEPTRGAGPDEVARLAETLNRMLAALDRARAAERRFVADASHELRNPLAALRGNAEYLAAHGADEGALDDLRGDVERLSRLVDDLLALTREQGAEAAAGPVSLQTVAATAAGDGIEVRADGPGWVLGDASALERALRNLVENALRYGPAGELVVVSVEEHAATSVLAVTDAGSGIPGDGEDATRPFWRGPNAGDHDGAGLGLALVRATAERHGGRLVIVGPRFALELPAAEPPAASQAALTPPG
jgi:two-component system, OmpR family, sensor kinase